MCLFICANPKAHQWLSREVDHSDRQALQLCVWPSGTRETPGLAPESPMADAQSLPHRLAIVRSDWTDWRVVRARRQWRGRLSKHQKPLNPFTEAWVALWGWIWGGR
jgi:hypothetical protein